MIENQWNLNGNHLDLKTIKSNGFDKDVQLNNCFYVKTRCTLECKLNFSQPIIEAIAFIKRREFYTFSILMNASVFYKILAQDEKGLSVTFDGDNVHKASYYGHTILICNYIRDNSILVIYSETRTTRPSKAIHIFIDEPYLDRLMEREIEESNKQYTLEQPQENETQVL